MKKICDFKEIDRDYGFEGTLGAQYSEGGTRFSLWSPCADSVTLRLYRDGSGGEPYAEEQMEASGGIWSCGVLGDLDGVYYTYAVEFLGEKRETPDIYGKAAGLNGRRSMVISPKSADIEGFAEDKPIVLKSVDEAVIYELHTRDFTMDESADFKHRGKLLGLCESGVKNAHGDPAGIDHLTYLGVTHVQLLPVMDFASVDEAEGGYNWGYDPWLYNVPEGSYSENPDNGAERVRELKTVVREFHKRGIGVILDVVYNHTFSAEGSPFDISFPDYYYRKNEEGAYSNGSGCGNEIASERRMVRKFICDSLCYLASEYHLDGFRFDLMGLIDIDTMNLCAEKLREINPDILLYGEGWAADTSVLPEEIRAVKANADKLSGIAMFSDDFRDSVRGSVFEDDGCGYISGVRTDKHRELIKSVMLGGAFDERIKRSAESCWAAAPLQSINFVECHDNLTLWDKLSASMKSAPEEERRTVDRFAAALTLLSRGIPFLAAGQEFLRSKGGEHNSYNLPDSVNMLRWNGVTENRDTVEYYRGLIEVRKSLSELRSGDVRIVNQQFGCLLLYFGDYLLVANPSRRSLRFFVGCKVSVLVDETAAGAEPFREMEGIAKAKPQSVLLVKIEKADEVNGNEVQQ